MSRRVQKKRRFSLESVKVRICTLQSPPGAVRKSTRWLRHSKLTHYRPLPWEDAAASTRLNSIAKIAPPSEPAVTEILAS